MNKLKNKSFNKDVFVLAGGTTLAQIVIMLSAPIITRIYTPEDFGILGIYTSLMSVFAIIATLKYELAIPLPNKDVKAANLLFASILSTFILSIILVITVSLYKTQIASLLNTPQLSEYLWALPYGVLFVSIYNIFSYWAIRKNDFKVLSTTKIFQSTSSVGTQIGLGLLNFGVLGLILGQIIGQSFGIVKLYKSYKKASIHIRSITSKIMKYETKKHINFPKYSVVSTLVNTISSQAPPLLFAALFSPTIAGLYVLSQRIVTTPMNLIGTSISKVFHANLIEAKKENKISSLGILVFEKLVKTGLSPLVLLLLISPELFSLVFGHDWLKAGIYVQYLIPWLFLVFIASPLSNIIFVIDKQKQNLYFHISLFIVRVTALYIGYKLSSDIIAVILFSTFSFIIWLIFIIWLMKIMNITFYNWTKIILIELIYIFPFILLILSLKYFLINYDIGTIWYQITMVFSSIAIGVYILFKRIIPIWKN